MWHSYAKGLVSLSVFGLGVLGFFLYMVGYKLMLAEGKIPAALGVLGLLVILGSGLLSVFLFAKAKDVPDASSVDYNLLMKCPKPQPRRNYYMKAVFRKFPA